MANYYKLRWHGKPVFQCLKCQFDTMDEGRMVTHQDIVHSVDTNVTATCIMPTFNRVDMAEQAISCFLAQTYTPKELVIVDDGDRKVPMPLFHPEIVLIRCSRRLSIGVKRNIACNSASGAFIVHMDDDDYSHPTRVAEQIKALKTSQICGLQNIWMGSPGDASVQELTGYEGWIAGATMAYWRDAWKRFQFHNINLAEDMAFLSNFKPSEIGVINKPWLVLIRNHGSNTSDRSRLTTHQVPYKESV